jgi:hypothetical protein
VLHNAAYLEVSYRFSDRLDLICDPKNFLFMVQKALKKPAGFALLYFF